jgi:hypothetical protein
MISEIIQNNRGWPIWINGIRLNRKQGLSLGLFLVNQALSKQTARGIHADLRDWGHEWKSKAEDFEVKLDKATSERDELDRENTTLLNRIEELERSLAQAEAELVERGST